MRSLVRQGRRFGMGLLMLWLVVSGHALHAEERVTLLRTPDGGIQPQAALDSSGVVHLIYFKGDPNAGDLFYVRLKPDSASFSAPIRVNSQSGSAIATGTIRGGQIAIGQGNRVHVVWNGSQSAEPKGAGGMPLCYTRLNDAGIAFEPQRNLITWAGGLDGGGSVAADAQGSVYVAWHANPNRNGEANRAVYLACSRDGGKTFARETRANPDPSGACGCCSLRAFVDSQGALYLFYRAATESVHRDMMLLVSWDRGTTFQAETVDRWTLRTCPMSSATLSESKTAVLAAWETQEQVFFATIERAHAALSRPILSRPIPVTGKGTCKHPVVMTGANGETLLAWTEGTGWNRGGGVAWQVYDRSGTPTETRGRTSGVPVWSLLSAFARPNGSFVIVY